MQKFAIELCSFAGGLLAPISSVSHQRTLLMWVRRTKTLITVNRADPQLSVVCPLTAIQSSATDNSNLQPNKFQVGHCSFCARQPSYPFLSNASKNGIPRECERPKKGTVSEQHFGSKSVDGSARGGRCTIQTRPYR